MSTFITNIDVEQKPKEKQKMHGSSQEKLKKLEEKYLSYSIKHDIKYTDIEKVEEKYREMLKEKYEKFNKNKSVINQLKKNYQDLIFLINKELLENYELENNLLLSYYDSQIEKLKKTIRIKEHEHEVYKSSYNRLYHSNVLIKKRVESEIKYESLVDNQYTQYQIIKWQSALSFKSQDKRLNRAKQVSERIREEQKSQVLKKANLLKSLDYELDMIKQDLKRQKNILKKWKEKEMEIKKELAFHTRKCEVSFNDIKWERREYFKKKFDLIKVLKFLRVMNTEELISNFINIRKDYESLYSQFKFYNKEIKSFNNELTQLEADLKYIKLKIKTKQENESTSKAKNVDNLKIRDMEGLLKEKSYYNSKLSAVIDNKKCILQKIANFIIQKLRKLFFQFKLSFEKKSSFSFYSKLVIIITKYTKDIDISIEVITFKELIQLCYIFLLYINWFFKCFSTTMNSIITENLKYSPDFYLDKTFSVIYLFGTKQLIGYSRLLEESFKNKELKSLILRKKEKDILKNLNTVESNHDYPSKSTEVINQSTIINQFSNYLDNEYQNRKDAAKNQSMREGTKKGSLASTVYSNKSSMADSEKGYSLIAKEEPMKKSNQSSGRPTLNKTFFSNHQHQIQKIMSRYQNDLVYVDQKPNSKGPIQVIGRKKWKSTSNSPGRFKMKNQKKKLNPVKEVKKKILQKAKSEHSFVILSENEEPDFSEDEETARERVAKMRKEKEDNEKRKIKFFKDNPEMAAIYKRINDLRMLDLKYFKKKSKNLQDSENFTEVYQNFEKNYLSKEPRIIRQSHLKMSLKKTLKLSSTGIKERITLIKPKRNSESVHFLDISQFKSQPKQNRSASVLLDSREHKGFLKGIIHQSQSKLNL